MKVTMNARPEDAVRKIIDAHDLHISLLHEGGNRHTWLTPMRAQPCSLLALPCCSSLLAFIMPGLCITSLSNNVKNGALQQR